jgi:hypothetical protein
MKGSHIPWTQDVDVPVHEYTELGLGRRLSDPEDELIGCPRLGYRKELFERMGLDKRLQGRTPAPSDRRLPALPADNARMFGRSAQRVAMDQELEAGLRFERVAVLFDLRLQIGEPPYSDHAIHTCQVHRRSPYVVV